MSRRLLTAGLSLAVLLGAQAGLGRILAKPPDLPLVENDVLVSSPLLADESDAPVPAPAMDIPSLFQLRPSVRRTIAACVLFGVHPLLALAPTEEYLDVDLDDYAPATTEFPFPPYSHTATEESLADAPLTCPYLRQQECVPDRHLALFADPDFSRDVLQNLEALRKSRELLEKARELGREGRVIEALDALDMAAELCPGSRFKDEIQVVTAQVIANENGLTWQIEEKLSRPVTLNFTNTPLRQVFDNLRVWADINIYVDKAALDAEEVSLDRLIALKVENVPLRSALNLILKEAHLTYRVKDEVVQITTERSVRAGIRPSLPPVDAGVPAALDQVLYETLKVGLAAAGESEEQETPVVASPHGWMEFGVGLDGSFRMFTQFERGGAVWHVEYSERGLTWWASPDGGASKE